MKQISIGTGLVVLSGTILASVFLSSPRTATTAFASTQQAQPAERGVGRKVDSAAPVPMLSDCELIKEIWFNTSPREISSDCFGWVGSDWTNQDMDMDGQPDGMTQNIYSTQEVVTDSHGVALSNHLIKSFVSLTEGGAKVIHMGVLDLPPTFGDWFVNRYGITRGSFVIAAVLDCDGDNDLDLIFYVQSQNNEKFYGWLENTGFQHPASLEGDLNGDGHIDSADLGRLLGGYTG